MRSVMGCWPRSERYFTRNDWVGRLRRNGRWVLDSPANNALAHFLHLTLFLLGDRVDASANPSSVTAELYRANRVENYDTCSMRFTAGDSAVPVVVAFTHAAATTVEPVIVVETDTGSTLRYLSGRYIEIHTADGAKRETLPLSPNPHKHMLAAFAGWVRGSNGVLGSSLEMARAHVVAVNAASEAAPVIDVPAECIQHTTAHDGTTCVPSRESCRPAGVRRRRLPASRDQPGALEQQADPDTPDQRLSSLRRTRRTAAVRTTSGSRSNRLRRP